MPTEFYYIGIRYITGNLDLKIKYNNYLNPLHLSATDDAPLRRSAGIPLARLTCTHRSVTITTA